MRRSPFSLVVLFCLDCLDLLASAVPDRRLCRHHAYVVLLPEGCSASPGLTSRCPQMTLFTLALPLDQQALLDAMARATRALGIWTPA